MVYVVHGLGLSQDGMPSAFFMLCVLEMAKGAVWNHGLRCLDSLCSS